jgi:hypothetical protein
MALIITDTPRGISQRLRCATGRRARVQARAAFVAGSGKQWR